MPESAGVTTYAPGARVEVRDEEWIVRSVRPTKYGGQAVHVAGVSELVSGKEAIFLTALDQIRELRPEETSLVNDDSPQYRRSRLYLDALFRRTPATDAALCVGHRGAIRLAQYQLQPAAKALRQLRPRILMADGVGLGKTIEVGILLSELIQRGRGERILVVALKSILSQFQKELWARFTIPLVRLDSVGIQRVQGKIPSNMNPFYYFDRVIISIDTLKRDEKYRRYLEASRWDVVVVDECQHVAIRGTGSQRARLAGLLGTTTDALILTSATPHDGRAESFASLVNLLEPTAIANPEDYAAEDVQDFFLRRFKKDVAHEIEEAFRERQIELQKEPASPEEDAAFHELSQIQFRTIARHRGGKGALFRTLLLKAFLSSPAACLATIDARLKHQDMRDSLDSGVADGRVAFDDSDVTHDRAAPDLAATHGRAHDLAVTHARAALDPAVAHDRAALESLRATVARIGDDQFRKLQALLKQLRELGLQTPGNEERVVIFSERIDTLKFLRDRLRSALGLSADQIELFHGTLDDQDQQRLVQSFGTGTTPIRVLLASDAASEGINLHYHCHRMVHFDLPWSLITLEQRNGRIDRFGQTETPRITYLLTIPSDPELKGDLRVLERLIEKEDAAHKNLGDVAWLMGLHDAEKEEDRIARGIEDGEVPESILPEEEQETDFMRLLFGEDAPKEEAAITREPFRLIAGEMEYAREAFREVLDDETSHVEWHDHLRGFTLHPPADLIRRFEYLPAELLGDQDTLKMTVDRDRVMDALEEARQDERKWPQWQLFWELHPVAEWLDDRVLGKFARHEAPVLRVATGMERDERVLVFQCVVSNHRSQPVIVEWNAVRFKQGKFMAIESAESMMRAARLEQAPANPGRVLSPDLIASLTALLAPAVEAERSRMKQQRNERAQAIGKPLREGLRKLGSWRDQRVADLERRKSDLLARQDALRKDQEKRLEQQRSEVERRFDERKRWIEEGLRTVEEPYLRLAAVLIPLGAD